MVYGACAFALPCAILRNVDPEHVPAGTPARASFPSVLGAVVAALVIAGAVALAPRGTDPAEPPPHAAPRVADEVLRLETIGPREAAIWHGDFRLGRFQVAESGHVTGDALIRLPRIVRRFGPRSVAIVKPDDLEQVVAEKVKNMCLGLGALNTRIVPAAEVP